MNRTARVGAMIKILSDSPSRLFGLGYFCKRFGAAKSSISEDISLCKEIVSQMELGVIETLSGAKGGVRFIPYISDARTFAVQDKLCNMLRSPGRILGGGFLYTSDIMFDPHMVNTMAPIFARKFGKLGADYIATIETKGIPLALMTSRLLNIPTIVVRRETKISEGPTVSINYFSGSVGSIQKMSLAKKATVPGTKAVIIDDFMRAGGSLKGIVELLGEFEVDVCGIGVAIASVTPEHKKIQDYTPLVFLGEVHEERQEIDVFSNGGIFE